MTAHGAAPQIDENGIEHRWGCPMSGWEAHASRVPGFAILTCPGCGAVRIAPHPTTTRTTEKENR